MDEAFRPPQHQMILIEFTSSRIKSIKPLLSFEKCKSGFCKPRTKGVYFSFPVGREIIGDASEPRYAKFSGGVLKHDDTSVCIFYGVMNFEVETNVTQEGLKFEIDGNLSEELSKEQFRSGFSHREAPVGSSFSVHGTIPWATIKMLGLKAGLAYWRHCPRSSVETAPCEMHQAGQHLEDLAILEAHQWPCIPGEMRFSTASGYCTASATSSMLILQLERDNISLWYAGMVHKLSSGFCALSSGREAMSRRLSLSMFGGNDLLRLVGLSREDNSERASLACHGNGLGTICYQHGLERSHIQRGLSQEISSFELQIEKTLNDLQLNISGTLRPFREIELAYYMKKLVKKVDITPWENFVVRTVIPKTLFAARKCEMIS